ncbi:tyrosine-protein phosphatase [Salinimicrobium marinum]|uniref:tyrosine-protein phosphatase n=1 Tax=Salinimicrobium marinum TaxID=680283 RepID=UPI0027E4F476|nr:CpsB/CapC family capsule biosynthesis tyrosine phosphatase [Salinimicrobium marinum]
MKDHLNGLVDIHNHILPGIDDGAATVEDSLALIKMFSELGITEFIATPHVMNDYYPNTPETVHKALEEVKLALPEAGLNNIKIKAAAEYMMDQSFLEIIEKEKLLTVAENFVLVEMSYFQAPINLNEILFQIQTKKYQPILAHPERYAFYHSKDLIKYEELKDRGCLFQLNLLSITGHYGKNIQETAFQLLDRNMIDFIGTDTHQMRHLDKLLEIKMSEKRIDQLKPIFRRTTETFKPFFD